ncbi:MAG: glycosyl hydrolase family 39, partial [Acidobacteriaceae bacterium]|nr:glycosyl hydrolase family 39 [Acidobacteriaceae bacterium]
PRKKSYFDLYAHTARALKAVSPRLRVGGPASSAAYWIPDFLKYCADNHAPVDFVSTHGYADDTVEDLFGPNEEVRPVDLPPGFPKDIPMDERVARAIAKVRGQIQASTMPNLPLMWTEWNVQGMNESRDTIFVGPALANTIRQANGVDMLSFWTFSDVFEEGGPIPKPFEGEFGLRAKGGINKPSYYAYGLLHQLGDQRIANSSSNVIVTKSADGSLAIAAWNLVDPDKQGQTHTMTLNFRGVPAEAKITLQRVDSEHGNVLPRYAAMGKPVDPTPVQVEQLNRETALPAPEPSNLKNGKLDLELTPNALVMIKVQAGQK